MKKIQFLRMLYHAEQIIIDSLKKIVETRIACLHYVFSDTGNTMEGEFGRSAGSKMA